MTFSGSKNRRGTFKPGKREPLDEKALYEYAVRSLGRKMRTVVELKRLMRLRVEPEATGEAKMEAVIARLKEHHYLDDTRYATDYTRMRQENERFGRRRVQQELTQRGVHSEIIDQTLDTAYADLPEADLAWRYIERKRLRKPVNDKETARVVRSMVRAGFSLSTVFTLLKKWKVDEETLAAVESIEPDPSED